MYMLLDLVIGEGSVRDVLSYETGEVLGKTSSPGQKWITDYNLTVWLSLCAEIELKAEVIKKLRKTMTLSIALSDEIELLVTTPNLQTRDCMRL